MRTAQPIVVGVDGSKASLQALREATQLADLMDCPLKVVTAWEWPATAAEYPYPLECNFEEDAKLRLAEALEAVFGTELPAGLEREVHGGPPARVLRDLSGNARMVVGSRGHGGFVGLLLGSVSTAVAAHAKCPVLITHHTADCTLRRTTVQIGPWTGRAEPEEDAQRGIRCSASFRSSTHHPQAMVSASVRSPASVLPSLALAKGVRIPP